MFVPTRSSRLKAHKETDCETVVYETQKAEKFESDDELPGREPTKQIKPGDVRQGRKRKKDDNNWNMKKLRYDIIKFGTTALSGTQKEESKIALAVSLGAAPPKKKYVNYKEILKAKEEEKKEKIKQKKFNRNKSFKKSKFKSNRTQKSSKDFKKNRASKFRKQKHIS
ncbi:hypothetical protein RUM44_013319 [Polyplax serrata]|uniref:Uncharacterized protein n=1 Tax=Polyplax serrata TaxID=468196 RepID=A0ABR1BHT8_POLSC